MNRWFKTAGLGSFAAAIAIVVGSVNAAEPVRREWIMVGTAREAMVCVPDGAKEKPAPLVFVFHGHGGTMHAMLRRYHLQQMRKRRNPTKKLTDQC